MEILDACAVTVKRKFRDWVKKSFNISILSEFESNIIPKYSHDRCERSVQMRLYTLSKPQFAVVIAIFFLSYAIALFIGLVGPPITSTRLKRATSLPNGNDTDLSRGPFLLRSPLVSPYCYQLWLYAKFHTDSSNRDASYEWKFKAKSSISGVREGKSLQFLANVDLNTSLKCQGSNCEEVILSHVWFLQYPQYSFNVSFLKLNSFNQKFKISDITFYWKSYNPSFTQLELWFRFIFMVLTFGVCCWFLQTLKSYTMHHWSMEQKWMAVLLPLLLLYNNPVFPLIFLVNDWFPSVLDAMFQATFLCSLLLFWLCVYHGVRQNSRKFLYFYLPKLILVILLWMCTVTLAAWDRYHQASDAAVYFKPLDSSNFESFKIIFYIIGSIYILYLGFLIIRAYSELKNLPYFDIRLKFFTGLMLKVIFVTILITVMKFGVAPTLQDKFVAHLDSEYSSSVEFMAFYGILNLYLYTMAYVYSPNPALATELQFRDTPGLSLLNDLEDEIGIYGAEEDEKPRRLLSDSDDE